MDHGKGWPSLKFEFLAANVQHQRTVQCVQLHTVFTKSEVRIMQVKCCCSFGEWVCQPFRYCLYRTIMRNLSSGLVIETPTKLQNLHQDEIINKSMMVKKKYIPKKNSLKTDINIGVLGDLLHLTMKSGQVIDFKEALKYPLSPILLNLSFPDSIKRSPVKSSLDEDHSLHSSCRRWHICQCWCIHCWSNGCNPSCGYFLDSRRTAHEPSTIHHSKRLQKGRFGGRQLQGNLLGKLHKCS